MIFDFYAAKLFLIRSNERSNVCPPRARIFLAYIGFGDPMKQPLTPTGGGVPKVDRMEGLESAFPQDGPPMSSSLRLWFRQMVRALGLNGKGNRVQETSNEIQCHVPKLR